MRKYQWMIWAALILLLLAGTLLLADRQKRQIEDGTFVLERTWNDESIYQGRGKCVRQSCAGISL